MSDIDVSTAAGRDALRRLCDGPPSAAVLTIGTHVPALLDALDRAEATVTALRAAWDAAPPTPTDGAQG